MTRPEIVHVLESTLGGTRQYLDDLVEASARLDLSMALVYATRRADDAFSGTLARARSAGWNTEHVQMDRAVRPLADLRAILKVRRVLARWQPRVVHCHSSKAGGLGRPAVQLLARRPTVVYSPHALAVGRHYRMIERWLARVTDRFVAISKSEAAEIAGLGLAARESIEVVHPIVDAARYRPRDRDRARAELGLPDGPLVLGIGRFVEQKNPFAFLRIVDGLRREQPDVRAIWIGDGELADAFERERRRRNLDEVITIEGWKFDVRPWIAAADVLLSVARFESFGYVVAEALAMERPVVASQVTGTVDVVQGDAAHLLFAPDDDLGAVKALLQVLRDPARAAAYAADGARHIRANFSPDSMAARLASTYGRSQPSLAPARA